ncbi:MAG TPA: fenitrothion hydrolase [Solirubrobacteraceae bacterium]|nr:fenitrothion hydrolase [Solirubrobacteraceae bacterium]
MRDRRRRMLPLLLGAAAALGLALPASADAHGIVGKADLPIPVWLFSWTAAIVLVVSFVALSTLWRTPQLQAERRRRVLRLPKLPDALAGAIGVGLFALVVYSGFDGAQVANANFSVTFVYVIFWVGLPVLSAIFGDVFKAFSPWRATARACEGVLGLLRGASAQESARRPLLSYPQALGQWPALAGILGFAWLELVYVNRDDPSTLAALALGYFAVMLAGMLLFGVEQWSGSADGFGVYFGLLARISPLVRDEQGRVCVRRPLSGLPRLELRAGTVTLICALIGTTTFDGFSNGGIWRKNEPHLQSLFADLGFSQTPALELAYSLGLLLCIGLIVAVYRVGILGVRSVSGRYDAGELTRAFAHTLVPIAFAYVLAHYFSLLLWQGQAIGYLASDPLGDGSNLLGTAGYEIDYHVISYAAIWYVQVAALIAGHVGGLALAHDRALVMYDEPEEAVRSQYWMLAVMVAFTSFGLWLLSDVGT